MIHFEIKNNILQVWFKEEVNYDDIIAYLEDFLRLADLPLNLKIIYDLTDAKIDLKIPQIIKISKLAKTATLKFDTVKTAFVVNDPGVTAYTMLFIFNSVSSKNIRKVFSTVDSAYSWVC